MASLFGFNFARQKPSYESPVSNAAISFVERDTQDTAAVIAASTSYGTYVDLAGVIKTEAELINRYREMLIQPEVDNAVDEIVNEGISTDEDFVVKIDLDDLPLDDQYKQIIEEEFQIILKLLDFKSKAYSIFKRWYVDGRLYYNVVIDQKRPDEGIKELRYVDPRKIRQIKEVEQKKLQGSGGGNPGGGMGQGSVDVQVVKNEYYLYNEKGFGGTNKTTPLQGLSTAGIRIAKDAIVHVPSGLTDVNNNMGLSYLHKGMKILNQLRTIEDSLIIYRLARAPERRVWYVDVGDLPRVKAEQYVRDVAIQQKNRLIYDADSGTIRDDRKFMTMLEDFWIPRRGDGSGTKVDTLQGGKTLGEIEDILYFQKQLYGALNVPVARLNPDSPFQLGRTQEVSRDEIKFDKFVTRLRQDFSVLFTQALEKQIVLKGLMTVEEWEQLSKDIQFEFARDNHFAELKDSELLMNRLQIMQGIIPLVGMYYSHKWVRRNILKQTDEDIEHMTMEIAEEMQDPLYIQAQAAQQEAESGGSQQQESQPQQSEDGGGGSQGAKYAQEEKQDKAKHIVMALKDVKNKSPGEMKKLRSAAQVLSKN